MIEEIKELRIYSPDPPEPGCPADPGKGSWSVSWQGIWLPILLADRNACLFVLGLVLGGHSNRLLIELRDKYNWSDPPVLVTAQMIAQHLGSEYRP